MTGTNRRQSSHPGLGRRHATQRYWWEAVLASQESYRPHHARSWRCRQRSRRPPRRRWRQSRQRLRFSPSRSRLATWQGLRRRRCQGRQSTSCLPRPERHSSRAWHYPCLREGRAGSVPPALHPQQALLQHVTVNSVVPAEQQPQLPAVQVALQVLHKALFFTPLKAATDHHALRHSQEPGHFHDAEASCFLLHLNHELQVRADPEAGHQAVEASGVPAGGDPRSLSARPGVASNAAALFPAGSRGGLGNAPAASPLFAFALAAAFIGGGPGAPRPRAFPAALATPRPRPRAAAASFGAIAKAA